MLRIAVGRLFHRRGPATANERRRRRGGLGVGIPLPRKFSNVEQLQPENVLLNKEKSWLTKKIANNFGVF